MLPGFIKHFIIRRVLNGEVPECIIESATELVSSPVIRNIMHMANNELHVVKYHDDSLFNNQYRDRISLYYGAVDKWVPAQCAEEQAQRLGKSCVFIDNDGCEHAFVIRHGEIMAQKVVSLLDKQLQSLPSCKIEN